MQELGVSKLVSVRFDGHDMSTNGHGGVERSARELAEVAAAR